jgi:alpha-beta hydrolase superfamily lysophospholipase
MTNQQGDTYPAYTQVEGTFSSFDSTQIFYQGWKPRENHRATIIFTHGHGEHSDAYHRVINYYSDKGYEFWGWDMRGHGRSEGVRGYAKSFQDYIQDYEIFLNLMLKRVDRKKPVFLLSHSMGGLIQLAGLMQRDQTPFQAQVVSAPLLGVAVAVPPIKQFAAEMFEKFLPKVTLGNELDSAMLTRDPEIMREYEKDPLRHTRMSSGVYLGFVKLQHNIAGQGEQIKIPSLFQCAEKDPVCSTEATRKFCESMKPELVKLLVYGDGARHEIYNDIDRLEVFKDMENYLENQMKGRA